MIQLNCIKIWDKKMDRNKRFINGQNIRFKISMLRSDLCDYSDPYIVVKAKIIVRGNNAD